MSVVLPLDAVARNHQHRSEILAGLLQPVQHRMAAVEDHISNLLKDENPSIARLTHHIEKLKGKRLRPGLVLLTSQACGGDDGRAERWSAYVELIHLASLCHDDILDEAQLRRGMPTVHRAFGTKAAVMTGDLLFSRVFEKLADEGERAPMQKLSRSTRLICEGEILQIAYRRQWSLTREEYLDLIEKKTAVLFEAAAELGAISAGADAAIVAKAGAFGRNLGMAFQIVDDLLDLVGLESTLGKSLGSDLRNGELTLGVIHLLSVATDSIRAQVLDDLEDRLPGHAVERLSRALGEYKCSDYILETAQVYVKQALDAVSALPAGDARRAMELLADYLLHRSS
ncbi:MAG TPA: polyprenyl synthetase family protein [Planctomycetota bacterium]|nr:polyprenyl synthetase family protein [Planctomycetota bacterium]